MKDHARTRRRPSYCGERLAGVSGALRELARPGIANGCLRKSSALIGDAGEPPPASANLRLYEFIQSSDKELAWTFNDPGGSAAFQQIAAVHALDLFTDEEFERFSEETLRGCPDFWFFHRPRRKPVDGDTSLARQRLQVRPEFVARPSDGPDDRVEGLVAEAVLGGEAVRIADFAVGLSHSNLPTFKFQFSSISRCRTAGNLSLSGFELNIVEENVNETVYRPRRSARDAWRWSS